jgi:putative permease
MSIFTNYKSYWFGGIVLVLILLLFGLLGEILLPFVWALFLAYMVDPWVKRIQTKIPNRNIAVTVFILPTLLMVVGVFVWLGSHLVNDTARLVNSLELFADQNEKAIEDIKNGAYELFNEVASNDQVQSTIEEMTAETEGEESTDVFSALEDVYAFYQSDKEQAPKSEDRSWNGLMMFIYTLIYFFPILYTYDYFEERIQKYTPDRKRKKGKLDSFWNDFKTTFLVYFRQRSKVVLIGMSIFVITFLILDLPGAILLGVLAGLMTFASHFHYISLPPIAIGCWVLSVEHNHSFFLYFGIILAVFILVSVLDETIFFTKIMKSVSGLNPAIMILSFVLWIYIFGVFVGTVIALPMTTLVLLYFDRLLLHAKKQAEELL